MKLLAAVSFVLIVINVARAEQYVFKFGVDAGRIIHTVDGNIPLLKYKSEISLPIPTDVTVTYVEVTVDSVSPPKVQYDSLYHRVLIDYSWTQITLSSYKILVKGF